MTAFDILEDIKQTGSKEQIKIAKRILRKYERNLRIYKSFVPRKTEDYLNRKLEMINKSIHVRDTLTTIKERSRKC